MQVNSIIPYQSFLVKGKRSTRRGLYVCLSGAKLKATMITIDQIKGKRILIRADLDVDVENGLVLDNFRLKKLIPTLTFCLEHASKVHLIGHRGRPQNGPCQEFSLIPVQKELERLINRDTLFRPSGFSPEEWWKGEGQISMSDNLRFDKREETLDFDFARELVTGCEVYIYEAFATYRPCTSLSLVPKLLPTYTGFQFDSEINTLSDLLNNPLRPTLLIGSGSKPEKLDLLKSIAPKFDNLFLGGVFAEKQDLTSNGLDINESGWEKLKNLISLSSTIIINGPLGKFEDGINSKSTALLFGILANSNKTVILGGGDTISAMNKLGFSDTQYGFVSTGGGGMLEFLDTGTHPLLTVLSLN